LSVGSLQADHANAVHGTKLRACARLEFSCAVGEPSVNLHGSGGAAPSMQSIALEGRRVAEVVLRVGSLAAEGEAAESERADLAAQHLQLLLAYGRSAAAGERIGSNDAVMILNAAIRVAETTRAWT